jgi:hypothetical protein
MYWLGTDKAKLHIEINDNFLYHDCHLLIDSTTVCKDQTENIQIIDELIRILPQHWLSENMYWLGTDKARHVDLVYNFFLYLDCTTIQLLTYK